MAPSVKVTGISLPPELLEEVDTLARGDGRNRSNWITVGLRELIDIRTALAAGGRLVKVAGAGVWASPDSVTVFYEDQDRPDDAVELVQVVAEWRSVFTAMPGASVAWHAPMTLTPADDPHREGT